ncbi:MAG TPA: DinB family protein [Acidimicrobiales bacterium]|nr:DinB family protein [Acidimicrobiales bacterium]
MSVIEPHNHPPRIDPDQLSGEKQALDEWVDFHRATLLMKCDGLTSEQLKSRSVEPSTLTLLGLVRHMSDVERGWFRRRAAGEDVDYHYSTDEAPDADFLDVESAEASEDLAHFVAECQRCREATAGLSLDLVVTSPGHHRKPTRNVRWIYLHMIEEYARHNGHADLLRERIDGVTGD